MESQQGQSNGDDTTRVFSPDALAMSLSLAESIADPERFLKFQTLESHGLKEFSTIAAEIANSWPDSAQRADAYLTQKRLLLDCQGLENILPDGPVLVACNHRHGYLDGVIMEALLSRIRPDRKFLSVGNFGALMEDKIIGIDIAGFAQWSRSTATLDSFRAARAKATEHLQGGGCLCVFPGAGFSTYDRSSGVQSDAAYTAFAQQLEMLRSVDYSLVAVFIDCQFRRELFEAFETTDWEFFALQWAEINNISDRTIPVYVGRPNLDRPSSSIAHAEQLHSAIHRLPSTHAITEAS